jgi:hypothetical protein
MIKEWIRRYFSEEQFLKVLGILSDYGKEAWHREEYRVKRDALIISRGSIAALKSAIELAMRDYRDVLISEQLDQWVIGEIQKYDPESRL